MENNYSHIITCCNTGRFSSIFGIALLTTDKKKIDYLDLTHPKLDFSKTTGFTGIAKSNENYYIGAQGHPSKILILDKNLSIVDVITLSKYYDIHSMDIYNNSLYFAASSTNQVIKIDLFDFSESVYWESPNSNEKLHLNVVKFIKNDMYVLFHRDFDESSKQQGTVYNVTKNKKILSGLKHPHDLHFNSKDNILYVSSSAEGKVFSIELDTNSSSEAFNVPGFYSRGLCFENGSFISGISAKRLISRKQGKKISYYEGGFEDFIYSNEFNSYLNLFNLETKEEEKINFTHIGNEIYEVFKISDPQKKIKTLKRSQLKKAKVNKWILDKVN